MQSFARETNEFVPVDLTLNGVKLTANVEFSVVPFGQRAGTWSAAVMKDGLTGITLSGKSVGTYTIWGRTTLSGETPVVELDHFQVT